MEVAPWGCGGTFGDGGTHGNEGGSTSGDGGTHGVMEVASQGCGGSSGDGGTHGDDGGGPSRCLAVTHGVGITHGVDGGGTCRLGVLLSPMGLMEVASQGRGGTSGDGVTHGTVEVAALGMVSPMG